MIKQRKYGLIGYPLSHSFSPGYFLNKFEVEGIRDTEYRAYPISKIEDIRQLIKEGLSGFNITIPYKQQIIPFLDEISEAAKKINAVNTVKILDGKLHGYNTDVYGFEVSLRGLLGEKLPNSALILGSGGASQAVQYVLERLGIHSQVVSRKKALLTYAELDDIIIHSHPLIVNTSPLGMYPNIEQAPDIPYLSLGSKHILYDLIYNPEKTLFLKKGEEQGSIVVNGQRMLHLQADKSWEIWNS